MNESAHGHVRVTVRGLLRPADVLLYAVSDDGTGFVYGAAQDCLERALTELRRISDDFGTVDNPSDETDALVDDAIAITEAAIEIMRRGRGVGTANTAARLLAMLNRANQPPVEVAS